MRALYQHGWVLYIHKTCPTILTCSGSKVKAAPHGRSSLVQLEMIRRFTIVFIITLAKIFHPVRAFHPEYKSSSFIIYSTFPSQRCSVKTFLFLRRQIQRILPFFPVPYTRNKSIKSNFFPIHYYYICRHYRVLHYFLLLSSTKSFPPIIFYVSHNKSFLNPRIIYDNRRGQRRLIHRHAGSNKILRRLDFIHMCHRQNETFISLYRPYPIKSVWFKPQLLSAIPFPANPLTPEAYPLQAVIHCCKFHRYEFHRLNWEEPYSAALKWTNQQLHLDGRLRDEIVNLIILVIVWNSCIDWNYNSSPRKQKKKKKRKKEMAGLNSNRI